MTPEIVETYSIKERKICQLFLNNTCPPELKEWLSHNKSKFDDYINSEKYTSAFLDALPKSLTDVVPLFMSFLDMDTIEGFPDAKKEYWKLFFLSDSSDFKYYLIRNKAGIGNFHNGENWKEEFLEGLPDIYLSCV